MTVIPDIERPLFRIKTDIFYNKQSDSIVIDADVFYECVLKVQQMGYGYQQAKLLMDNCFKCLARICLRRGRRIWRSYQEPKPNGDKRKHKKKRCFTSANTSSCNDNPLTTSLTTWIQSFRHANNNNYGAGEQLCEYSMTDESCVGATTFDMNKLGFENCPPTAEYCNEE